MKFLQTILIVFFINSLYATTLEVEVFAGWCSSTENGQARAVVSGGTEPFSYQWSMSNEDADLVSGLTPGDHSLTVTDATGCEATVAFSVPTDAEVFVNLDINEITCFGLMNGRLVISDFFPADLQFSLDGVNFSTQTVYENIDLGEHILYILESNGCVTEEEFFVVEPNPLVVDFGPDVEIALGDSILLEPVVNIPQFNIQSIQWIADINIPCESCFDNWVRPFETTTVQIIITNENGCTTQDEITVFVVDERKVFIPNIFTPNGDGFNDIFYIHGGQAVTRINQFLVRDNFGGIVYESQNFQPNDPSFGWDGYVFDKPLGRGVFVYMVEVEYIDATIEQIFGTVTLLK